MTDRTCEGFTLSGERCTFPAKHFHETPGDAMHLCSVHYHMVTRPIHTDGGEQIVRRWRSLPGAGT